MGGIHQQLVGVPSALERAGRECDAVDAGFCHLVEARAGEQGGAVARAESEPVKGCGRFIGLHGQPIGLGQSVLVDGDLDRSGPSALEGNGYLELVGLWRLPDEFLRVAGGDLLLDHVDADRTLALEMQGVIAANDERGSIGGIEGPLAGLGRHELKLRPLPIVETPLAAQLAGKRAAGQLPDGRGGNEAATGWIGDEGNIGNGRLSATRTDVQNQIVRHLSGEE